MKNGQSSTATHGAPHRGIDWPAVAVVLLVPIIGFILLWAAVDQPQTQAVLSQWVNETLDEMDRGFRSLHAALSQR